MIRRDLFKTLLAGGMLSLFAAGKAAASEVRSPRVPSGRIDARLAELGITLPEVAPPVATYVPFRQVGNMVYTAGQGPAAADGMKFHGRLGEELTIEEGYLCARQVGLNLLAVLKLACGGDLDRVVQCVRLGGFVLSADGFTDQPKVINGASDLLVEVFGDAGRHARTAVGTNTLPFNLAVEIDAIFEIRT
jgi:enamine deaminase RidA (YjgF/YER057c/UK114 family)